MLAAVAIQGGWIYGTDWLERHREHARPMPADRPNVLLIVLDTVRVDHLGLYGYERPTSPHLEDLAGRSVRFNQARATAPWTLASHASMFTGRWPHELDAKWMRPMRGDFRTLAEYLGSLGYATFGFVGNTFYCAYDSGLDRGFTEYRDYVLNAIAAFRTVYLVDHLLDTFAPLEPALDRLLAIGLGRVMEERSVRQLTHVRPQGRRGRQPRAARLAGSAPGARPAVLRVRQLRGRPRAVRLARGRVLPLRHGPGDRLPITCSSSRAGCGSTSRDCTGRRARWRGLLR